MFPILVCLSTKVFSYRMQAHTAEAQCNGKTASCATQQKAIADGSRQPQAPYKAIPTEPFRDALKDWVERRAGQSTVTATWQSYENRRQRHGTRRRRLVVDG
jgi:hypothetical protein